MDPFQTVVSDDSEFETRLETTRDIRHMLESLVNTFKRHLASFKGLKLYIFISSVIFFSV